MTEILPIAHLNARFAIPGCAQIVSGNGGLPKIQIASPAASAEIYLHGAQVTSWKPAGADQAIFLSRQSHFEPGRAIRGGIPVCFPWFRAKSDDPKAPAHGFVRTKAWQLESLVEEGDSVAAVLATESDEASRKWWPFEFRLALRISVGAELKLELTSTNTGAEPWNFEEALHTYYRVGDAEKLKIAGLNGAAFLDNRENNALKLQSGDLILSDATDNAYLHTQSDVEVADLALDRRISLKKTNSLTTVAWNPWRDGAASMADLGGEEWREFVCVEASNILASAIHLAPGQSHTLAATISVTSPVQ